MNLAICVPSHNSVSALFAHDLAQLVGFTSVKGGAAGAIEGIGLFFSTGTLIHRSRENLLRSAMQSGADYILWLDSDMRFPADTALRLLSRNVEAVGVNASTRKLPPSFTAVKTIPEKGQAILLETTEASTGVEEVDACGFGVFLIKTDRLKRIIEARGEEPLFQTPYEASRGGFVGEDIFFCRLLRQHGGTIHVDHDLSKEIGHEGTFEYRTMHVEAFQG